MILIAAIKSRSFMSHIMLFSVRDLHVSGEPTLKQSVGGRFFRVTRRHPAGIFRPPNTPPWETSPLSNKR
jgi:hypothetical protein